MCTYHCCKSFVYSFSEALSYELRKTDIKVLTLCPGPFNSKFVDKAHNGYTFKLKKPLDAVDVAKSHIKITEGKRFIYHWI